MHIEAKAFVKRVVAIIPPRSSVLEIGSRNINGGVRELFGNAKYFGIDIADGEGVDLVADGVTYLPSKPVDCVVCCEVLEHAVNAEQIVRHAVALLSAGGVLIVTCATEPRLPHSAVDGGPLRKDEFYRNVPFGDLAKWMDGCRNLTIERSTAKHGGDLYAVGIVV